MGNNFFNKALFYFWSYMSMGEDVGEYIRVSAGAYGVQEKALDPL